MQSDSHDTADAEALDHARRVLAASREGVLLLDERSIPIRFVIANTDGRLIASVPAAALLQASLTLMVPEDSDEAVQLLLSPEQVEESIETDRWMAHHLRAGEEPEHVRWAALWIDSAKHGPWVFDGEAFMAANPAGAVEPRLCSRLNADRAALRTLVSEHTEIDVEDPVCVGVDGWGLLVRARFGVVRVWFDGDAHSAAEAEAAVNALIG